MKVYLFSAEEIDVRRERFARELSKIGIDSMIVNSYEAVILTDEIFYHGEELKINKKDFCWFIGNSMVNQYINSVLKKRKVRVWPTYEATNIFSDKFKTAVFFNSIKVKTPKTVMINRFRQQHLAQIVDYVKGFPCVIKNVKGTQGATVGLVKSFKEIQDFMIKDKLKGVKKRLTPYKKAAYFLQEYIRESKGEDYRVLCLGEKILGAMKRTSKTDFRANISLGGKGEKFEINQDLADVCKKIMKKGKLFYAGIDFVKKNGEFIAIEINTSAEFKGFEEFTGVDIAKLIVKEIKNKFL